MSRSPSCSCRLRPWRLSAGPRLLESRQPRFSFQRVFCLCTRQPLAAPCWAPPSCSAAKEQGQNNGVIVGTSYHNDTSPPLRDMKQLPVESRGEREANENPKMSREHKDSPDEVVQDRHVVSAPSIPATILNFDGIPFPGVACNCAPPDTNGEVGLTQYVQIVNEGFQVFNKTTGASVLGPSGISTIWSGFGGVCQNSGFGDPVVLYDQLANRWIISQFAGASVPTDECVAVSTTSDATGSYNRYGFHLGSNFFDYPKPERLARRLLHEHERVQLGGHGLPRPAAVRLRPGEDARRSTRPPSSAPASPADPAKIPICPPTWTARPCRRRRPGDVRGMAGQRRLQGLPLPRRLRRPRQHDLHSLRQPGRRGLHGAVPHDASLRAPAWHDEQTGRHRRPVDVPAGLPELRRPRIGGRAISA